MKRISAKTFILLAVILLIIAGGIFVSIYADYLQLCEIGKNFTKVFWTDFNVTAVTFLLSFVIFFILVLTNFFIIRNNLTRIDQSFSYLKRTVPLIIISLLISIVLALIATKDVANKFLPYLTSEWFNLGDPIFHQDVGYYVFQRPFYIAVINSLLSFSGFLILVTIGIYLLLYARFDMYNIKQILKERGIITHTIVGIVIYFLIKAISYKFAVESVLYSDNKGFTGAGYVDINLWYPYYKIAPIILILVVIATIVFVLNSKLRLAIISVLVYPATYLIALVIAGIIQTVVVMPNEMAVELPYINNNISFTRSAYKLDKITEKNFDVKNDLSGEKIMNNLDTVNNIRLLDFNQTLSLANQVQSIRNYYHFNDADIVLYNIGGKKTAVFTAAREMNKDNLDDSSKNYINMKLKYTHGMGIIMNPVNQITDQGQPNFIIKDIPPRSAENVIKIKEPRIYFGEENEDYVIVNTKDKEIDDIDTRGYSYSGKAGIPLNFVNRLIYSAKYADFRMLMSSEITSSSKLLVNKNVIQRVKKVAPFLKIDNDPTIVVDDEGRLKWVIDAYTTSSWYPYAQYSGGINYIRNSVKVVVDAYDGTVKFYIIDNQDPIIKSYSRIYPTLFEKDSFPQTLASHIRYPEYLFNIQANILKKYHITDSAAFYNKLGMWAVSKEKSLQDKQRDVEPYYNLMKLDNGEANLELMLPYTLVNKDKDNMVAWLAANCNINNYGQLTVYKFSDNSNIYGTFQVENRIDADPEISRDLTLWGQGTSSVIRGNMLVIPIENNLLYVEPIYITGGQGEGLPEVKRIIVAYGDKIVSKPTFDEAISALFGVDRPDTEIDEQTIDSAINNVIKNYNDIKSYTKDNDWENYGRSMKKLDESIEDLKKIHDAENKSITPQPSQSPQTSEKSENNVKTP